VFRLSKHPEFIDIGNGVQDAFRHLGKTWRIWVPVVVVLAVAAFVLVALFGSISGTGPTFSAYTSDSSNGGSTPPPASGTRPPTLGYWLYFLLSTVAGWVFTAIAITGLRNRPLTLSFVVSRGVLTIVAGIVIVLIAIVAAFFVVFTVAIFPLIGLLLLLAAVPVAVYLAIRVIFYNLAIFDGFGPIEGIRESWRLSRNSVLRLFGWGLMAVLIGFGFSILALIVSFPYSTAAPPLGQAFSSAVTATGSCFTVLMMAVLYESQRARLYPYLYGVAPTPAYPASGYPTAYPSEPVWSSGPGQYPPGPSGAAPGGGTPAGPESAWKSNAEAPPTGPTPPAPAVPKPPEPPASS